MAWIKVDHGLPQEAEVEAMALSLGQTTNEVVGGLCRLWIWFSEHTGDGAYRPAADPNVGLRWIDRKADMDGLAVALRECGWLDVMADGTLALPNFEARIGSAKAARSRWRGEKRSQRAKRECPDDVRADNPPDVSADPCILYSASKAVPASSPELPAAIDTPEVREAWAEYEQHRREKRSKLTPTTVRRAILALERESGGDPDVARRMILQTIEKGWLGIFALKDDRRSGHQKGAWLDDVTVVDEDGNVIKPGRVA